MGNASLSIKAGGLKPEWQYTIDGGRMFSKTVGNTSLRVAVPVEKMTGCMTAADIR